MLSPYQDETVYFQFLICAKDRTGKIQKFELTKQQHSLLIDFVVKTFPDGFKLINI